MDCLENGIPDGKSALSFHLDLLQPLDPLPDLNLSGQVQLLPSLNQGGPRAEWVAQGEGQKTRFPTGGQIHLEIFIISLQWLGARGDSGQASWYHRHGEEQ